MIEESLRLIQVFWLGILTHLWWWFEFICFAFLSILNQLFFWFFLRNLIKWLVVFLKWLSWGRLVYTQRMNVVCRYTHFSFVKREIISFRRSFLKRNILLRRFEFLFLWKFNIFNFFYDFNNFLLKIIWDLWNVIFEVWVII